MQEQRQTLEDDARWQHGQVRSRGGSLHTADLLVDAVLLRKNLHGWLDNTTTAKGSGGQRAAAARMQQ